MLLGRLLIGGRPEDISPNLPADVTDMNIEVKDLPASLLNEIVVLEIVKPYITNQAWKKLHASIKKGKK